MKLFYSYSAGERRYAPVLEMQESLRDTIYENSEVAGQILLLEHAPVYTMGIRTKKEHLLLSQEELKRQNIDLHTIRRGGDITYHGPGQLMFYPIVQLHRSGKRSISDFVSGLGEMIAEVMRDCGVSDAQWKRNPSGIWTEKGKIAAVGFHFRKYVGTHGFAINVHPNLSYFSGIIPCGLSSGVTSIKEETGSDITVAEVAEKMLAKLQIFFSHLDFEERNPWENL
ncbi:lipoyl(octanoyl) transferase LipB [bacterium]|nr:lipoyl(octanoyl) transferase LipB [bacterium]